MADPRQDVGPADYTALFAKELDDLVARFDARFEEIEETEQSVFQTRREGLQNEIRELENQMRCLEQDYEAAKKSREETRRANFWTRISKSKYFVNKNGNDTPSSPALQDPPSPDPTKAPSGIDHDHATSVASPQHATGNADSASPRPPEPSADSESQPITSTEGMPPARGSRRRSAFNIGTGDEENDDAPLGRGLRKRTRTERATEGPSVPRPEADRNHGTPNDSTRKKRKTAKTISFADLYQGGEAKYKHKIVRFPKDDGKWFILRCNDHLHFGNGPLMGAVKHLSSKHHNMSDVDFAKAIDFLGVQVLHCNEEKAEKNNAAFQKALNDGYKPFNFIGKVADGVYEARGDNSAHDHHAPSEEPHSNDEPEQANVNTSHGYRPDGIQNADLIEAKIYLASWKPSGVSYVGLVLPLTDFDNVGMSGSFKDTGLDSYIPRCYASQGKRITGWADGFEEGGESVLKRKYPIMYFNNSMDIPLRGKWEVPREKLYGWVAAKLLREFDFSDKECQLAPGYEAAKRFRKRMARMKSLGGKISMLSDGENEHIDSAPQSPTVISLASSCPSMIDGVSRQTDHSQPENHGDHTTSNDGIEFDDCIEAINPEASQGRPTSPDIQTSDITTPSREDECVDVRSNKTNDDSESYSTSELLHFIDEVLQTNIETEEQVADVETVNVVHTDNPNSEVVRGDNGEDDGVRDIEPEITPHAQTRCDSQTVSQVAADPVVSDYSLQHQSLAQAALAGVALYSEIADDARFDSEWQDNQQESSQELSSGARLDNNIQTEGVATEGQDTQSTTDDVVRNAGVSEPIQSLESIGLGDNSEDIACPDSNMGNYPTEDLASEPNHLPTSLIDSAAVSIQHSAMSEPVLSTQQVNQSDEMPATVDNVDEDTIRYSAPAYPEMEPVAHNQEAVSDSARPATATPKQDPPLHQSHPNSGRKEMMLDLRYVLDRSSPTLANPTLRTIVPETHAIQEVVASDVGSTNNTETAQRQSGPTLPTFVSPTQHQPPSFPTYPTNYPTNEQSFNSENVLETAYMQSTPNNAQSSTYYTVWPGHETDRARSPPDVEIISSHPVSTTPHNSQPKPSTLTSWERVEGIAPLSTPVKQLVEGLKSGNSASTYYYGSEQINHQQSFDQFRPQAQTRGGIAPAGNVATGNPGPEGVRNFSYEQYTTPRLGVWDHQPVTGPEPLRPAIPCLRCKFMRRECDFAGPPCGTCIHHGGDACPGYPTQSDGQEGGAMQRERPPDPPFPVRKRPLLPPIMYREAHRDNYA